MQEARFIVKHQLDPAQLTAALDNVHRAGMPGVFAEVRDGDNGTDRSWQRIKTDLERVIL